MQMMRLFSGLILGLGTCTGDIQTASDPPDAGVVRLNLPPGFMGFLDDRENPVQPGVDLTVPPGAHTVVVQTPCGEHRANVAVTEGGRAVLGQADFEGLRFAKLTIAATTLEQKPLRPSVTLGSWTVPGHASETTAVPACKARMKVSAPELGAFIEDLDLQEGDEVQRSIVLAPGSDVVRIHGGALTFRDGQLFPDAIDERGNPDSDPFGSYQHTLATFEIDQREVTTAEFHACSVAGACTSSYDKRSRTPHPKTREESSMCTTSVIDPQRTPREGKEDVAMNCVVAWEAEEYCRWQGKRLPTVEEWEFAARSRGDDSQWLEDDRRCDDGKSAEQCPRNAQTEAAAPCTIESTRTAEGLCDMFGNLAELITTTPRSPKGEYAAGWAYGLGGAPWGHDGIYIMPRHFDFRQRPWTGFRCARSLDPTLTQRHNR